jgi:hypothetical protein
MSLFLGNEKGRRGVFFPGKHRFFANSLENA